MSGSKTTFASEAGRYLHLGVFAVLALLSVNHLAALPFLFAEGVHLWKTARRIFAGALFCTLVLLARMILVAGSAEFADTEFSGVVTETATERFTVRTGGRKVYVFHDGSAAVVPGDCVDLVVDVDDIEPRSVEHGFDYGKHLRANGIAGTVRLQSVSVTGRTFVPGSIAHALRGYAEATFGGAALAMVRLFVLGDPDGLPDELEDEGKSLGITHLFAVSGMHVGAIALFLENLLRRLHLRKGIQAGAVSAVLVLFAAAAGFAVSIVRAVAAYLVAALNGVFRMPFTGTDVLAFVLVAVLFANPFAIHAVGFQLSYLVSFVILLSGDVLRGDDPVRKTLKIGLVANAASLPILLELNGSFNPMGIAANLVFVLFVDRLAVPLAFLAFFVPASEPLLDGVGNAFFLAIEAAGSVDLSIGVNFASDIAKALYWLIAGVTLYRLSTGKKIVWGLALASLLAFLSALAPRLPGESVVKVFDVGQGDALYIAAPGCRMLVDTGRSDPYDTLLGYFRKENVRALDVVVLTHGDDDHAGEIADLDAGLAIGTIVAGGVLCPGCRAQTTIVSRGDELACGTLSFAVLSAGDPADNDGSVILFGTIGSDRWLFTGDASADVEERVAFPDADVLKAGHHGSATSTSASLVAATTPEIAVISVGRTNGYGHPAREVLDRLEDAGAFVLRTDERGTITFRYPPWGGRIVTSHSEDRVFENAMSGIVRIGRVFLSSRRRDIMDTVIG